MFLLKTKKSFWQFGNDAAKTSDILRADLFKASQQYLIKNYAPSSHTFRGKKQAFKFFCEWYADEYGAAPTIGDLNPAIVQIWVNAQLKEGKAPSTIQVRYAHLSKFGKKLSALYGVSNPFEDVRLPKASSVTPKGLSAEEKARIFAVVLRSSKDPYIVSRNMALIHLFLETGLRASELASVAVEQIKGSWINNVNCKGQKSRNIYLNEAARSALKVYLLSRVKFIKQRQITGKDLECLFFNNHGKQLQYETIKRMVGWVRARSNVPKLHAHTFRHTFAHDLLDSSKDIRLVSQAMGHASINTTMRYTERKDEEIATALEAKG